MFNTCQSEYSLIIYTLFPFENPFFEKVTEVTIS